MAAPQIRLVDFKLRLEEVIVKAPDGAVVFDADGTLWSHDVGCMVYDHACEEGLFLPDSQPALLKEAQKLKLPVDEDSNGNTIARALKDAWYSGDYGERAAAEMQVWAYVGMIEADFRSMVRRALEKNAHADGIHHDIVSLAAWVREQGARALIVSASPQWVVEEAAAHFGFAAEDIAAGVPHLKEDLGTQIIQAGMQSPLPYGPDKVTAGKKLLGASSWLAALGDSTFDLQMMAEAQLAGGIGAKNGMLEGLAQLPHGFHIQLTPPNS